MNHNFSRFIHCKNTEFSYIMFFLFLAGLSGAIVSMVSMEGAATKVHCVLTMKIFQFVKMKLYAGILITVQQYI